MKQSTRDQLHSLALGLGLFACIALYAGAYVMYQRSIMPLWAPVTAGITTVIIASRPLAGVLRRSCEAHGRILTWIAYIAVAGAAGSFAFTGSNVIWADNTSVHREVVTIDDRHTESHQKVRRVGRHTVRNEGTYRTYHIGVTFPDGHRKSIEVNRNLYNRIHSGDTISLEMRMGLLGYPVLTPPSPPQPHTPLRR